MLVLADTSVWVDHLRKGNACLVDLLERGAILMHPCVLGELALGSLKNRRHILQFLARLPAARIAADEEVLYGMENRRLWGCGLGWIDAQLLMAALLSGRCALWTFDKTLQRAAEATGVAAFHV